jgi:hypothetical protein
MRFESVLTIASDDNGKVAESFIRECMHKGHTQPYPTSYKHPGSNTD